VKRVAIVLLLGGFSFAQDAQAPAAVAAWIAAHAIPLSSTQAGHGFADLEPLKSMIGDARIVALGEATHGTREFFEFHHRMLEFLASEMGFTTLAVEASMPEAYKLNDYVVRGEGDPAELLKGLHFWTLDTVEMLDLIHWMREFNQSGKGHLEFTGFDMQYTAAAAKNVGSFLDKYDSDYATTVKPVNDRAERTQPGTAFGVATATFPVEAARGKKIRFTGFIKTEDVMNGYAGLWWRVDGATGVLAFDNMYDRGVRGTTGWKEYSIELPVAADARNINFGALLPAHGIAWFDDFKIELDGKPYTDSTQFDLGFESPTPKGFYTGGAGYRVELDAGIFHGGKQSLRMERAGFGDSQDAVDPVALARSLREEMNHMQASRASYRQKGATDAEIDWAFQNTRVIRQCVEVRAGAASRDQSMADNIRWISQHPPGTKMVVVAHNAHIQTVRAGTMGTILRAMFGGRMITFGLAFNQGSFRAVSESSNLVTDFSVPPALPGSLDATLAAAGIPRFAIDLRQLPAGGPVADWWKAPHDTRNIGTIYPENSPHAMQDNFIAPGAFDVMVFFANTTAAHRNAN
jgi:erythromycin esterase-like protein